MQENSKEKSIYPLGKTLRRMLRYVTENNKRLYLFFTIYTISAVIYPFFPVILPKLLINELSLGDKVNLQNILYIVLGYFVLSSIFGYIKAFIVNYTNKMITLLRLDILRDRTDKIISFE